MYRTALGDEEIDPAAYPFRVRTDTTHADVRIEAVRKVSIQRVEASGCIRPRLLDRPQVDVGGEAAREFVPEERDLSIVRRPDDRADFHIVLRQPLHLPGGDVEDEEVLKIWASVVRLRDVGDPATVVRPSGLRDVESPLRDLLRLLRFDVQFEDMLPKIVDEAFLVEPEVDPTDRPDVFVVLSHVREEEDPSTIRRPRVALDPFLPPQEETGLAAVGREHVQGVPLVVLAHLPLRGEEDPLSVGRDLGRGVFPRGRHLNCLPAVQGDSPQIPLVLVLFQESPMHGQDGKRGVRREARLRKERVGGEVLRLHPFRHAGATSGRTIKLLVDPAAGDRARLGFNGRARPTSSVGRADRSLVDQLDPGVRPHPLTVAQVDVKQAECLNPASALESARVHGVESDVARHAEDSLLGTVVVPRYEGGNAIAEDLTCTHRVRERRVEGLHDLRRPGHLLEFLGPALLRDRLLTSEGVRHVHERLSRDGVPISFRALARSLKGTARTTMSPQRAISRTFSGTLPTAWTS